MFVIDYLDWDMGITGCSRLISSNIRCLKVLNDLVLLEEDLSLLNNVDTSYL